MARLTTTATTAQKADVNPDAILRQYQQVASGESDQAPSSAYEFEEEKRTEEPLASAAPEQVFHEYNNPNVQSTAGLEDALSSQIQDVDLSDGPMNSSSIMPDESSRILSPPGLPVPASLSSPPTKAATPSPAQKRTFEDSTIEDESAAREESIGDDGSSSSQSAQAIRNKATEPAVFWADLREWLSQIEKVTRVSVSDPVQLPRTLTNPNPSFTFLVKSSISPDGVRRRYSDFETLRIYLVARFPGILILALPEKKAVGNKTEEFLSERAKGLQMFLGKLVENEYLRADPFTRAFLVCQPGEWESAKKRVAQQPNQPLQAQGDVSSWAVRSSSPMGAASSEERWKAAIQMTKLPEKHEEEITRASELLSRLDHVLRSLLTCAYKCAQASKAYSSSVRDLHRQMAMSQMVSSLAALQSPVEFWSEASAIEPVIIEELLVESLQKEVDVVAEMKRMLDSRKELMVAADQRLAILHKYEDECETMKKTGQLDRAARSAQKVQDALKQVKQADFKLEIMTKAMFLAGLGSFVPSRIEALAGLMGRFAFGEMRFGDLMKSVWLGVVASLRLDLTQVEADCAQQMETVRGRIPERFRTAFVTVSMPSSSSSATATATRQSSSAGVGTNSGSMMGGPMTI